MEIANFFLHISLGLNPARCWATLVMVQERFGVKLGFIQTFKCCILKQGHKAYHMWKEGGDHSNEGLSGCCSPLGSDGWHEGSGCSLHLVSRQSLVPDFIKCSKLFVKGLFFSACSCSRSMICGYKGIMQVKAVFPIRVMSMQTHYFAFSIFSVFMNKETWWVFSLKIEVKFLSCRECGWAFN